MLFPLCSSSKKNQHPFWYIFVSQFASRINVGTRILGDRNRKNKIHWFFRNNVDFTWLAYSCPKTNRLEQFFLYLGNSFITASLYCCHLIPIHLKYSMTQNIYFFYSEGISSFMASSDCSWMRCSPGLNSWKHLSTCLFLLECHWRCLRNSSEVFARMELRRTCKIKCKWWKLDWKNTGNSSSQISQNNNFARLAPKAWKCRNSSSIN